MIRLFSLYAIIVLCCILLTTLSLPAWAAHREFFVAPFPKGDRSGSDFANAASYIDYRLWSAVREALNDGPVTVTFQDGKYSFASLEVREMGHPEHRLVLQSETPGGAVFVGPYMMKLAGVQNATVRGFTFSGLANPRYSYLLQVIDTLEGEGPGGVPRGTLSHHILIEGNYFVDAPTIYGAVSIRNAAHHVTVYNNTFRNIGSGSGAHMLYIFADVHHVKIIGNTFTDCRGDYIRFRHNADIGEVRNNTFTSTAPEFNLMFIRMNAINDVNPGNEYHADTFLIRDNSFTYYAVGAHGNQDPIGYTSSGFNPVGLEYMPNAQSGKALTSGDAEQIRRVMLDTMNIDLMKTRVYNNTFVNERYQVRYYATASFGAQSQGWTGLANISNAVNSTYIGAGDVYSDGLLDDKDIALFVLALEAEDELDFLLDERVWFGDYQAADINQDGKLDAEDAALFIKQFADLVPAAALDPVRKLL
ncbi:MAG: hypothetical protein ACOX44_09860 [Limnochordia bacterium]|jgi:hypothetical protein